MKNKLSRNYSYILSKESMQDIEMPFTLLITVSIKTSGRMNNNYEISVSLEKSC